MKRYEVFSKSTITNAVKEGFSPNCFRDFANKADAITYVREYYKNTDGRISDLVICEVNYNPIFEITFNVTSKEKDL